MDACARDSMHHIDPYHLLDRSHTRTQGRFAALGHTVVWPALASALARVSSACRTVSISRIAPPVRQGVRGAPAFRTGARCEPLLARSLPHLARDGRTN